MNVSMLNSSVTLQNLQYKLDVVANNMANLNTTGFKRKNVTFHDVLTDRIRQPEDVLRPDRLTPPGFTRGWGAAVNQVETDMSQGTLVQTGNPTDFALEGGALFEVLVTEPDEQGNIVTRPAWTADGAFDLRFLPNDTENVYLTTKEGYLVRGADDNPIAVPDHHRIQVDETGRIFAYSNTNPESGPVAVGQLKIVRVLKPQLLANKGDNLYELKPNVQNANGEVLEPIDPAQFNGPNGFSIAVRQGFLEQSNVNLSEEMVEALAVHRSFQLNARALQSGDAMLNLTVNLRG